MRRARTQLSVEVGKEGLSRDASELSDPSDGYFSRSLSSTGPEQGVPGPYADSAAPGDSSAGSPALQGIH